MATQDDLTAAARADVQKFYYSLNAGVEGGEHQDADEHQDIDRIMAFLQQTRQAALREAIERIGEEVCDQTEYQCNTITRIIAILDRLISEGGMNNSPADRKLRFSTRTPLGHFERRG